MSSPITGLPALTSPTTADLLAIVNAGITKKITLSDLNKIINAGRDAHGHRVTADTNYPYYSTPTTGSAPGTAGLNMDIIFAVPFICPVQQTVDRIALSVNIGAPGNARLGIYDDLNRYPNNLILDAGTVSVAAPGWKEIGTSANLNYNQLYWLVHLANVNFTIAAWNRADILNILGFDNAFNGLMMLAANFGYAPLPATYPGGANYSSPPTIPAMFLRFSA